MKALLALTLCSSVCWAQTPEVKNLMVIPPWTMRSCPKEVFATYDLEGAKGLRLVDNQCTLWRDSREILLQQVSSYTQAVSKLKEIVVLDGKERAADAARIQALMEQLKKEIKEKNEYKYKPSYAWMGWAIGGGVGLVATSIAFGLYLSK